MGKPDYAFWDRFEEFTLLEAAYLICNLEPETWQASHPTNVKAILSRLYSDLRAKNPRKLRAVKNDPRIFAGTSFIGEKFRPSNRENPPGIDYDTYGRITLRRGSLVHWCESHYGEIPPFLVPEKRGSTANDPEPRNHYDPKEAIRKTLEAAIRVVREKDGRELTPFPMDGSREEFHELVLKFTRTRHFSLWVFDKQKRKIVDFSCRARKREGKNYWSDYFPHLFPS